MIICDWILMIGLDFHSPSMKIKLCAKSYLQPRFDPCAKSVQYLELMNILIFPKIFSTGDILTLVDHTLIDHTACSPNKLINKYGCVLIAQISKTLRMN